MFETGRLMLLHLGIASASVRNSNLAVGMERLKTPPEDIKSGKLRHCCTEGRSQRKENKTKQIRNDIAIWQLSAQRLAMMMGFAIPSIIQPQLLLLPKAGREGSGGQWQHMPRFCMPSAL
ncbi:uncharacterized protein MYCFIDRAFT_182137 [Pseudocercospora fijiensis CIRAD86]|uniref:Uncharacterized protein n=1 Tax=Pseudocercospora fijiensis (strain CIRAD86) TaxID=383855 RepID=M2ZB08_PSEFD|nr:uncharacterized protein MYCFIDRAFT_182137 [Pseudocercospora fijiensis CIRAD86]EME87035.1 hypothetical protein MYCFIDRAFT_182137 [Pseudocercospora fijiensis CIRAD86]